MLFLFTLLHLWLSGACAENVLGLTDAALNEVGQSEEWKGLLQYQKNFVGSVSSEVAGKKFFLSEDGKTNPVSELKATLAAFLKPVPPPQTNTGKSIQKPVDPYEAQNEHAICLYPARFQFLVQHLKIDPRRFTFPHCTQFQAYRSRVQTKRVSIIFSSYYVGSASSVFGHSFLLFSGENENELFDSGINFAANPNTENPILYAVYGMAGVFPATFSAQAYYYKIREYNDFESRDLWTYELNLTQAQKDFLLNHIWELGNTYFDYYYFNQNCSYHILRALEASVPSIRFFKKRPVYLIPSDSIKLLYEVPGLVKKVSYRPSIRSVAFARYAKLDAREKETLLAALHTQSLTELNSLPNDASRVRVLDALIDAVDLNEAKKLAGNDPAISEWKRQVLEKRASLREITPPLNLAIPENEAPHLGHSSKRMVVRYGQIHQPQGAFQAYTDLELRASHHDLLDPSIGYPRTLHIDFGKASLRYLNTEKRFLLNSVDVVDLTALSLEHPLYSKLSYEAKLGFDRGYFSDCTDPFNCPIFAIRGGVGKTYPLFEKHLLIFMADLVPSYSSQYLGSRFKLLVEPSVKTLFEFTPSIKFLLEGFAGYTQFTDHPMAARAQGEFRYVVDSKWGLGVANEYGVQAAQTYENWSLKGFYYF